MTQDKQKKLIMAITIGAVTLLLVLVITLTIVLVKKGQLSRDIELLENKCAELQRLIDNNADIAEIRETREWIEKYAREHGYMYKGDIKIGDTIIEIPEI